MVVRQSAGILLFRRPPDALGEEIQVLLAHPGGPFFRNKDEGHWSIPKGEPDATETDLLEVARREFAEEVGSEPPAAGPRGEPPLSLGSIIQKGGKLVHAWALEGDLDPEIAASNTFEMEWPPRSGQRRLFPEIDRVAWFRPADARIRLKPTQVPFVDRLVESVVTSSGVPPEAAPAGARSPKPDAG